MSKEAVNAMALLGRATSYWKTFLAVVTSLILCTVGGCLVYANSKNQLTAKTTGTVFGVRGCQDTTHVDRGKNGATNTYTTTTCTAMVTYSADGRSYSTDLQFDKFYTVGSTVTVYYDPKNPLTASSTAPMPKWIGWLLVVLGFCIVLSAFAWSYLVSKNKTIAALAGTAQTIDTIL